MYLLIMTRDDGLLAKIRKYLQRLGFWVREFNETEYNVGVTAKERAARLRSSHRMNKDLNPPAAWKTCASFKPKKGRSDDGFHLNGTCSNPSMLNSISCPKLCTKYEPTNIDAVIYVAEQVISEHELRADELRQQIEFLKRTDLQYREMARTGGLLQYRDGQFVVTTFDES